MDKNPFLLSGSVGRGRCKNNKTDVENVRKWLRKLGFFWVKETGAGDEHHFVHTIKLFQSICRGYTTLSRVTGQISKQGFAHKWFLIGNRFLPESANRVPCGVDPVGHLGLPSASC